MADATNSTNFCGSEIKPDDIYLERFKVIKVLSQKDGVVIFLAEDLEVKNGYFVFKQIDKEWKAKTTIPMVEARRALCLQSKVNHMHIMRQTYFLEDLHYIVVTMPYAHRENLGKMLTIEAYPTDEGKRKIMRSLFSAIYFCHANGFAHNNITLENVLVDADYNAYLTGFHCHRTLKEKFTSSEFTSVELYKPPEVNYGEFYCATKGDIWAAGAVLYKLIFREFPYKGGNFDRKILPENANGVYKLIGNLLENDPKTRYSISEACEDPWLNENQKESCLDYAKRLVEEDHKFNSTMRALHKENTSMTSVEDKKTEKLSLTEQFKELESNCKDNNVQMGPFEMLRELLKTALDEEQQKCDNTEHNEQIDHAEYEEEVEEEEVEETLEDLDEKEIERLNLQYEMFELSSEEIGTTLHREKTISHPDTMADATNSTNFCGSEIKPDDIYLERFKVIKVLSQKDGVVIFLAEDLEVKNGYFVFKQIDKEWKAKTTIPMVEARRALCLQSKVNHMHIMRQTYFLEDLHKIVVTMPYAHRENLGKMLTIETYPTEEGKRKIMRSLFSAIYFCHANGFAHNDITLENILVDADYNAYLTGFHCHRTLKEKFTSSEFTSTELYKPPEVYYGEYYCATKADIWSAGVVLYKLIFREFPYKGGNFDRKILPRNANGVYKLIGNLLENDPKTRYSISEACEDPWLNENQKESCLDYAKWLVEEDHKLASKMGALLEENITMTFVENPANFYFKISNSVDAKMMRNEYKKTGKLSLSEKFKEVEENCKNNNVHMDPFEMLSKVLKRKSDNIKFEYAEDYKGKSICLKKQEEQNEQVDHTEEVEQEGLVAQGEVLEKEGRKELVELKEILIERLNLQDEKMLELLASEETLIILDHNEQVNRADYKGKSICLKKQEEQNEQVDHTEEVEQEGLVAQGEVLEKEGRKELVELEEIRIERLNLQDEKMLELLASEETLIILDHNEQVNRADYKGKSICLKKQEEQNEQVDHTEEVEQEGLVAQGEVLEKEGRKELVELEEIRIERLNLQDEKMLELLASEETLIILDHNEQVNRADYKGKSICLKKQEEQNEQVDHTEEVEQEGLVAQGEVLEKEGRKELVELKEILIERLNLQDEKMLELLSSEETLIILDHNEQVNRADYKGKSICLKKQEEQNEQVDHTEEVEQEGLVAQGEVLEKEGRKELVELEEIRIERLNLQDEKMLELLASEETLIILDHNEQVNRADYKGKSICLKKQEEQNEQVDHTEEVEQEGLVAQGEVLEKEGRKELVELEEIRIERLNLQDEKMLELLASEETLIILDHNEQVNRADYKGKSICLKKQEEQNEQVDHTEEVEQEGLVAQGEVLEKEGRKELVELEEIRIERLNLQDEKMLELLSSEEILIILDHNEQVNRADYKGKSICLKKQEEQNEQVDHTEEVEQEGLVAQGEVLEKEGRKELVELKEILIERLNLQDEKMLELLASEETLIILDHNEQVNRADYKGKSICLKKQEEQNEQVDHTEEVEQEGLVAQGEVLEKEGRKELVELEEIRIERLNLQDEKMLELLASEETLIILDHNEQVNRADYKGKSICLKKQEEQNEQVDHTEEVEQEGLVAQGEVLEKEGRKELVELEEIRIERLNLQDEKMLELLASEETLIILDHNEQVNRADYKGKSICLKKQEEQNEQVDHTEEVEQEGLVAQGEVLEKEGRKELVELEEIRIERLNLQDEKMLELLSSEETLIILDHNEQVNRADYKGKSICLKKQEEQNEQVDHTEEVEQEGLVAQGEVLEKEGRKELVELKEILIERLNLQDEKMLELLASEETLIILDHNEQVNRADYKGKSICLKKQEEQNEQVDHTEEVEQEGLVAQGEVLEKEGRKELVELEEIRIERLNLQDEKMLELLSSEEILIILDHNEQVNRADYKGKSICLKKQEEQNEQVDHTEEVEQEGLVAQGEVLEKEGRKELVELKEILIERLNLQDEKMLELLSSEKVLIILDHNEQVNRAEEGKQEKQMGQGDQGEEEKQEAEKKQE